MSGIDKYLNTVHCMDCLEFMKTLPDKCIDCIFADLPFYQDIDESIDKDTDLNAYEKKVANYKLWNSKLSDESFRVLKEGGNVILVNAPKYIFDTIPYRLHNFIFRNGIPLYRRGSLRPAWQLGFQHNYMVFMTKGSKKLKRNGGVVNHDKNFPTDVWLDIPYQNGYRGKGKGNRHPEAINIEVVERAILLNSLDDDIVLDFTAGSGTTGVACRNLNRNYILVEKEPKYFDIINKRLANTTVSLFHSPTEVT